MNPRSPTHVEARWMDGFSSVPEILAPSFSRKAIIVKSRKKIMENESATAMNAGVVAVGAERRLGEFPGRTERSETMK